MGQDMKEEFIGRRQTLAFSIERVKNTGVPFGTEIRGH